MGGYTPGPDEGVLDRPARRGELPPRLRGRRRNRVLVPGDLPGSRAADPDREDVAVRRLAGRRGGRDYAAARNWRSDDANDEAGIPRPSRPRPHDQVRRPARQLRPDGRNPQVTTRPEGNGR